MIQSCLAWLCLAQWWKECLLLSLFWQHLVESPSYLASPFAPWLLSYLAIPCDGLAARRITEAKQAPQELIL